MFNHGSYGIQSEGWSLTITEEVGSSSRRPRKDKGHQGRTTKESVCECCGKEYGAALNSAGRFCSTICHYKHKKDQRPHWFECSKCLATIGLGMDYSARAFNTSKTSIHSAWGKEGIRAKLPIGHESWRSYCLSRSACGATGEMWWINKGTADAWMSEYSPKFPDWSNHPVWISKRSNIIMMRRYNSDMDFRIRHNIRCDMRERVRKNDGRRAHKTEAMLGCSIPEFRCHLESTFGNGMHWENYGSYWEIDHIIPVSWFDMTNPDHQLRCWHYSNLRALSKSENRKRGNRAHPQLTMTHILNEFPHPGRKSRNHKV